VLAAAAVGSCGALAGKVQCVQHDRKAWVFLGLLLQCCSSKGQDCWTCPGVCSCWGMCCSVQLQWVVSSSGLLSWNQQAGGERGAGEQRGHIEAMVLLR